MLGRLPLFCAIVSLIWRPAFPWRHPGVLPRSMKSPRMSQEGEQADLAFAGGAGEALSRVLTGLGEDEKYNTVLAGLATTLLAELRGNQDLRGAEQQLAELLSLLQEMQQKNIEVGDPAAGIVLDGVAASGAPAWVLQVMQALRGAGKRQGSAFGAATARLAPLPSNKARREKTLKSLPRFPEDQRAVEIGIAAAAISYASLGVGLEGAIPFTDDPSLLHSGIIPEVMLAASAVGAGLDLYGTGGSTLLKIRSGLSRLFYQDPARDSRVEASSLIVGYLLGLPSFPFRPSVQEALALIDAGEASMKDALPPTAATVNRILVWLLSPVAGEDTQYSQLLASDPRQGAVFLSLLRTREWEDFSLDEEESKELLRWGYAEARKLIRTNEEILDRIGDRMEQMQGSVGDCVAILDGRL